MTFNLFIICSLNGAQFVYTLVLPNTIWKFAQLQAKNALDFASLWKAPCALKLRGRRAKLADFQAIRRLLFVDKLFLNGLMDMTPEMEFDDELAEGKKKKFGLLLHNVITEQTHLIVLRFTKKSFMVQAKLGEFAQAADRAFVELVLGTLNTALSFLELESSGVFS